MNIVDDILEIIDDVLGVRDEIGALKEEIFLLTRTWSTRKGVGTPVDVKVRLLPTPNLVDLSHSLRLREGGMIKQGDILLKQISMKSYPTEDLIDCSSTNSLIEKFYYFGGRLYTVISIKKDYVFWNALVRKTSKTQVYL